MNYKIITAPDTDSLELDVKEYLNKGWKLHAGVSISFNNQGMGGYSFTYVQVVVKYD